MAQVFRNSLLGVTMASFLLATAPMPAAAGMIGTPAVVDSAARAQDLERVNAALARADVQQHLTALGVSPAAAAARAAALTPGELQDFARQLEQAPAGGGGALAVIGIVFVVLILLEYTGTIDIFKKVP
jgi:hypothetical protein